MPDDSIQKTQNFAIKKYALYKEKSLGFDKLFPINILNNVKAIQVVINFIHEKDFNHRFINNNNNETYTKTVLYRDQNNNKNNNNNNKSCTTSRFDFIIILL